MVKKKETLTPEEKLSQALVPKDQQPYDLPKGWVWTRLGFLASNQYGFTEKAIINNIYPKFLRITDIQDGEIDWKNVPNCKINKEDFEKYCLASGDILIARTGATTGKSCYISDPPKSVFASFLIRLKAANPDMAYFIYDFLQSDLYWKQISELSSGIAQPGVNSRKLTNIVFPLPPLPEQHRIVARIESLFAKLDEAQEKLQQILDTQEARRAAILHEAFTGGLTAKWRQEHGIGRNSWKKIKLDKLLFPMETQKPVGKYFRYIDIDAIDNKRQVVKEPKILAVSKAPSRASRKVESGDILFSMVRPYLKNIAVIDESLSDCIASTGFFVCKCKPELYYLFLYFLLCSDDTIHYLMQFMRGDNSPSIRKNEFLSISISLPLFAEQMEIVRVLNKILAKEQRTRDVIVQTLSQIDLLKKSVLARAFRGELGTQDPSDPDARELLLEQ